MTHCSRKDFLKLTSWGVVATLLPLHKVQALNFILDQKPNFSNINAFEKAAEAKRKFYEKNYAGAEASYLEAISMAPNIICFYDGLDNVYGAQNKVLESVILYREALLINTTKVAFYDRAARSLMRLELSLKKAAASYRTLINSNSLLADARTLYNSAIAISPKTYLTIGLNKVQYKIDTDALNTNYRLNAANKLKRKAQKSNARNNFKLFLDTKNPDTLVTYINSIDTKARTVLYVNNDIQLRDKHMLKLKKKYYRILLSEFEGFTEPGSRLSAAENLYNLDPSDSLSYKLLRTEYYRAGQFGDFVTFSRAYHDLKVTVYTGLGLMNVISIAVDKGQLELSSLDEAIGVGDHLLDPERWALSSELKAEVVNKFAKILVKKSMPVEATAKIENFFSEIIESELSLSALSINRLIYTYAKATAVNSHLDALNVLSTATKELKSTETPHPVIENITHKKNKEIFKDKLILYYYMCQICKNDINLSKVYETLIVKITDYNPLDNFVLTQTS